LRKTFRKILDASDIDEDTKEALMGHTLPGSRGSYFDMQDIDEIAAKYLKANFSSRLDVRAELEQRDQTIQELHQHLTQYEMQMKRIANLNDEEVEAVRKLTPARKGTKQSINVTNNYKQEISRWFKSGRSRQPWRRRLLSGSPHSPKMRKREMENRDTRGR